MPTFLMHTYIGGKVFFSADITTCRKEYQGEVIYMLTLMFAFSMCVVFILLLSCVVIPTWIENYRRRRNGQPVLENRIENPWLQREQPLLP